MSVKDQILELENIARALEPDEKSRKQDETKTMNFVHDFYNTIYDKKAFDDKPAKGKELLDFPFTTQGYGFEKAMNLFEEYVDNNGLNPASGGHLGYIPGGGIFHSGLADLLADVTNEYAGHFFAGPGAVRVENMVIRWLNQIIGFPETAIGNLTSGGSIANLVAITTARDAKGIRSRMVDQSVIYLSEHVHHCVHKAIRIAGLAEAVVRFIPLDTDYKMDTQALKKQLELDIQEGLNPFLLIASAGTTDLGKVDPLKELGAIAQENNLWYHVDGAYGGFFVLTNQGQQLIQGIEMADSVVMDPHKGLFLPYGLGAVLVKDQAALKQSHFYMASYMQDTIGADEEISPADVSPELTKPFRGLRAWLPLMTLGTQPFQAGLQEKLLLTQYFYQTLGQDTDFEMGPPPDLSVCAFRLLAPNGQHDAINDELVKLVKADGRVFLSSTTIQGKVYIRFACLSVRTHLATVDLCLKVLKEKSAELKLKYK